MLITLLLMNSLAFEALPLFMDKLVPAVIAIALSVSFVLIFGEILPSAFFTGPKQLVMAARMVPVIWFFMALFSPISYPISKLLDRWLGEEHGETYNKAELRALLNLHAEPGSDASANSSPGGGAVSRKRSGGLGAARLSLPKKLASYVRLAEEPSEDEKMLSEPLIGRHEAPIIQGAMSLRSLRVRDVAIPLSEVFMLSLDDVLDEDTMVRMMADGHR